MKKINFVFVLAIAFALFVCASGVVNATYLSTKYVGNTIVDLEWNEHWSADFSKYKIYRDGSQIATIKDRSTTFFRDSGRTKGVTYEYKINVYNATGKLVDYGGTNAKTGDVHGMITIDTTWKASASPYLMTGDVEVEKNVTLTIASGTTVKIAQDSWNQNTLNIDGTLIARYCTITGYNYYGMYYGNIHINGQDNIINGNEITYLCDFSVSSGGNTISNNKFSYCGGDYVACGGVHVRGDNTVINNNDFSSCFVSVRGNNSAVTNNIFNSASCGVSGSNNEITDNIFNSAYCREGCIVGGSNNKITDNIFNNSKIDIGYYGSSENIEITNNRFYDGSITALWFPLTSKNKITNNIFECSKGGRCIEISSSDTLIQDNIIKGPGTGTFDLSGSTNNTISDNIFENGSISLESSSNNDISNNKCSVSWWAGISLESSNDNIISDNLCKNGGIFLLDSNNNYISNNICENGGMALIS